MSFASDTTEATGATGRTRASAAPGASAPGWLAWAGRFDVGLASLALAAMTIVPLLEIAFRPFAGRGVDNAALLVQHLGLVMAMFGALAGERHGHLVTLGSSLAHVGPPAWRTAVQAAVHALSGAVCGLLALASGRFVATEVEAAQPLAYGVPVWWVQAVLPLGFLLLGLRLGWRAVDSTHASGRARALRVVLALAAPLVGGALGWGFEGHAVPFWPSLLVLLAALLAGAPIFVVLGGLALLLFWSEGLPLASVPLSHYQITVNPSLPALPLFTLAGLVFARTGAAQRLGTLFVALFGGGVVGTVLAVAVVCTLFTAFTGGSGVTILALGGLLLPLLLKAGYPEHRGIGLVTSASALGVLLAPSVPLIMYAVIARVPIRDMFLAGLLPAVVMVLCLVTVGGFLRRRGLETGAAGGAATGARAEPGQARPSTLSALWAARWELAAPLVAVGSLLSGIATPMESAALTAAYAIATQAFAHREMSRRLLGRCIADCAMIIGGVMLILGMALALTNFLVDAGVSDRLVDWVQGSIPNRWLFLLALCAFLFASAALMEIYAAIVVLVPLLLPLARAYGLDPVHFGIIFLAAMEVGFLCPPAGLNLYFASAMFGKPIRYVAASVVPAVGAIFLGTLIVAALPWLSTGLPALFGPGR